MSGPESSPPDDEAHDVLAAEAFALPARDPTLRHEPIKLPEDPTGIAEPHDVLAAEEFAMPAPPPVLASPRGGAAGARRRGRRSPLCAIARSAPRWRSSCCSVLSRRRAALDRRAAWEETVH